MGWTTVPLWDNIVCGGFSPAHSKNMRAKTKEKPSFGTGQKIPSLKLTAKNIPEHVWMEDDSVPFDKVPVLEKTFVHFHQQMVLWTCLCSSFWWWWSILLIKPDYINGWFNSILRFCPLGSLPHDLPIAQPVCIIASRTPTGSLLETNSKSTWKHWIKMSFLDWA